MDEWKGGEKRKDRRMHGRKDRCIYRGTDEGWMGRWMGERKEGQMDRWMIDRCMDRELDGCKDR